MRLPRDMTSTFIAVTSANLLKLGNMHFYLAEKIEGTEQFNYRNVENDIEPIFSSFNIALDRINQYGV